MARQSFAAVAGRSRKESRGRAGVDETPVAIRGNIDVSDAFARRIRGRLARKLGHGATLIERGTVRLDDVNGPRGGVDVACRIKLVLSGAPSVQVSGRGADAERAFAAALDPLVRTFERTRGRRGLSTGGAARGGRRGKAADVDTGGNGELIGRRVGRGRDAVDDALARPEKERRDAYVDTAQPGTSASDRKAGGPYSARRNSRARAPKATATLEDSRTRPSRKSTRRSANRGKPSQGKERTAVARSLTPSARAARRRS